MKCLDNKKLKVLELFAGIGACSKALENLGIEHEIVDAVEIDKYAIAAFNAIHGTNFEPQDIIEWDKNIECDLIMQGSPCQDFSLAGKQAGGNKGSGTRSSLMYETLRIVGKIKPKYVIWENVKNLLSQRHRHNFDAYLEAMDKLGYTNYYQVLNAKDYGVPQNRERVFTVSILGGGDFEFPPKRPLIKRLKDVLEDNVDEKYYLSDEQVASFVASTEKAKAKGNGFKFEPIERERERGVAHTIATRAGSRQTDNFIKELLDESKASTISMFTSESMESMGIHRQSAQGTTTQKFCLSIKTANKKGYDMATDGDGIDLGYPDSKTRRGRVGHGVSKTLPTSDSQGVLIKEQNNEKRHKADGEILQVLRGKIGEKAFREWAFGGLWCILSEAVLWERMYAQGIFESWCEQPELVCFAPFSAENKPEYPTEESVRNMWISWQDRYSPFRRELSEQQYKQLKSVVQKLPHEVASWQEFVQNLWQTSKRAWLLQQALSEIQKIWQSDACWKVQRPDYRIRKLTPLSCYRLMGFDDASFERASKVISNTQLYKTAGNSIVVPVLEAILTNLLGGED